MRVALVTPYPAPSAPARGGVEVAAARLAGALHRCGVEVVVVDLHGSASSTAGPIPVVALDVDERWSLLRDLRPMRKALARALTSVEPDIVHAQGVVPAGYVATHASADRIPRVVTAHGSRREDTESLYRGASARARWLLSRRMGLAAVARAQAVVGVHPDWRVNLASEPARFTYIPNIVDDRFFDALRRPRALRVLYCGGTRRIKGWDLIAAAWELVLSRLPAARLHALGCAGDVVPAAIEHSVDLDGWLSPQETADAMAAAAAVAIPSRFEVAPTVLGEAWAARAPVVAAAVGGLASLASGAATLVQPPSESALADALVATLRANGELELLVEEGYRRAQLQREETVTAAHLELYESLLDRPRRGS